MSHLIEDTEAIESEAILAPISREVVLPSASRSSALRLAHGKVLRRMYVQWKNKEECLLEEENERHMRRQF